MQVQILELVRIHAFAKKAKDVKWSYGRKIQQLSLELEHLQGIILYEWERSEYCINPLEFEAHK